jgi:hypothetical protein
MRFATDPVSTLHERSGLRHSNDDLAAAVRINLPSASAARWQTKNLIALRRKRKSALRQKLRRRVNELISSVNFTWGAREKYGRSGEDTDDVGVTSTRQRIRGDLPSRSA